MQNTRPAFFNKPGGLPIVLWRKTPYTGEKQRKADGA